jgi:hypothetical protein
MRVCARACPRIRAFMNVRERVQAGVSRRACMHALTCTPAPIYVHALHLCLRACPRVRAFVLNMCTNTCTRACTCARACPCLRACLRERAYAPHLHTRLRAYTYVGRVRAYKYVFAHVQACDLLCWCACSRARVRTAGHACAVVCVCLRWFKFVCIHAHALRARIYACVSVRTLLFKYTRAHVSTCSRVRVCAGMGFCARTCVCACVCTNAGYTCARTCARVQAHVLACLLACASVRTCTHVRVRVCGCLRAYSCAPPAGVPT